MSFALSAETKIPALIWPLSSSTSCLTLERILDYDLGNSKEHLIEKMAYILRFQVLSCKFLGQAVASFLLQLLAVASQLHPLLHLDDLDLKNKRLNFRLAMIQNRRSGFHIDLNY